MEPCVQYVSNWSMLVPVCSLFCSVTAMKKYYKINKDRKWTVTYSPFGDRVIIISPSFNLLLTPSLTLSPPSLNLQPPSSFSPLSLFFVRCLPTPHLPLLLSETQSWKWLCGCWDDGNIFSVFFPSLSFDFQSQSRLKSFFHAVASYKKDANGPLSL